MSPEIWVVVPLSRPEMGAHVLRMFAKQNYGRKRLLIVENGAALGLGLPADVTIQSEPHQSHARNKALDFLQASHPDAYWAAMDDDDFYGAGYLEEHAALGGRGRVLGKRNGVIRFNSGLVYFGHHWTPGEASRSLMGGTMGCYVKDAQRFPIVEAAEEFGFCESARQAGSEVVTSSPFHYVYNRTGNPNHHAYKGDERKLWKTSGGTGVRLTGDWKDWIDGPVPEGPITTYRGNAA